MVEIIGKIVKRKITHSRIALAVKVERAIEKSSLFFEISLCRKRSHETMIINTNITGRRVVATSLLCIVASTACRSPAHGGIHSCT